MLPVPVSGRNAKADDPQDREDDPGRDPLAPVYSPARYAGLRCPTKLMLRAKEHHNSVLFGRPTIHTPQDVCADHTATPRLPACGQLSTPAGACSVGGIPHTWVVPYYCPVTSRLLGPNLGWSSFCDRQSFPDQYSRQWFA